MAVYEKHEYLHLTHEEKTNLAFANLVLAGLSIDMDDKNADFFEDCTTGEVIQQRDIREAFHVLEFLQGEIEIV